MRTKAVHGIWMIGALLLLTGCGGGGGGTPAPLPTSLTNIPGGGFAGSRNVAYVPFRDGTLLIALPGSSASVLDRYLGTPVATPPSSAQIIDRVALSFDGTHLYGNASSISIGPLVYVDTLSGSGQTLLGQQAVTSTTARNALQVVPLANTNVVVITTSVSGAQSIALYDTSLTQTLMPSTVAAGALSSAVANPQSNSGAFFAVDQTDTVVEASPPSYGTVSTGIAVAGPIVADSSTLYATQYQSSGNSSALIAIDPGTFAVRTIATLSGGLYQPMATGGGKVLAVPPNGSGTAQIVTVASGVVQGVAIPMQGTFVSAALSPDGSQALFASNGNGSGVVSIVDLTTRNVIATLPAPANLLPNGQNILGSFAAF